MRFYGEVKRSSMQRARARGTKVMKETVSVLSYFLDLDLYYFSTFLKISEVSFLLMRRKTCETCPFIHHSQ